MSSSNSDAHVVRGSKICRLGRLDHGHLEPDLSFAGGDLDAGLEGLE